MTKQEIFKEILLKRIGIEDTDIACAYMYGSRVYGTARKTSDWDFIVVTRPRFEFANEQYSDNLINVNFYTLDQHIQRLLDHEPSAMECHFLADEFTLKKAWGTQLKIDLAQLRSAYSAKASNSWVKAKKKLTVEKDYNDLVGKKSLWHSLRLIDFGTQIARDGSITNYSSMNHLYDEVLYCKDWTEMFEKYKSLYNSMCTEFRKYAPKEI